MFILERIIGVVAPHDCLVCGKEGDLLCPACQVAEVLPVPSRCYRCKALTTDSAVCPKCCKATVLRKVWIRSEYSGSAKELARALKFGRAKDAAGTIANMMADNLPILSDDLVLVPIPTATNRVRQRGYDQSVLITRNLSKVLNRKCALVLGRLGQSRQVGASRQVRVKQLEGAFIVTKPSRVMGRSICLVDDVTTTGTTIEVAARVLKKAGAKKVYAAVFAQKV